MASLRNDWNQGYFEQLEIGVAVEPLEQLERILRATYQAESSDSRAPLVF